MTRDYCTDCRCFYAGKAVGLARLDQFSAHLDDFVEKTHQKYLVSLDREKALLLLLLRVGECFPEAAALITDGLEAI